MTAVPRLMREYKKIADNPVPYIIAKPLPENLLECHFVIKGPESTPYEGGIYHGKLVFPTDYPLKPPRIYMFTPSGRFRTRYPICLNITHPEQWTPAWTLSTIINGLLSFMTDSTKTQGSIETTKDDKIKYALESSKFNSRNVIFRRLFPEFVEESTD